MQSLPRVQKEFKETSKATSDGLSSTLVGDNIQHWKGTISGPIDSPYAGGTFAVDIRIPDRYPFVPPKMKFDTKIWHPNVSSVTGAICLDILKNEWSPALTIRTTLLSLQALLSCPEPDDPQDAQVATQYKSDYNAFKSTAEYWTYMYAKAAGIEEQATKISALKDMGIDEVKARAALESHNWDSSRAVDSLFTN